MSRPQLETRTAADTVLVGVLLVVSALVAVGLIVLAVKNPATAVLAGFALAIVVSSFGSETSS